MGLSLSVERADFGTLSRPFIVGHNCGPADRDTFVGDGFFHAFARRGDKADVEQTLKTQALQQHSNSRSIDLAHLRRRLSHVRRG